MDADVRRGLVAIDELLAEALGRLEAAREDAGKWGAVVPSVAPDAVIGGGLSGGQLAAALGEWCDIDDGTGSVAGPSRAVERCSRGRSGEFDDRTATRSGRPGAWLDIDRTQAGQTS